MAEFIVWSIRLWLVGYRQRVKDRLWSIESWWSLGPDGLFWHWHWLRDLVDRLSPFDPRRGYRRGRLRGWLWYLSHPRFVQKRHSLRLVLAILDRIAPYTGPGRFEGNAPQMALKVEWLSSVSEDASDTAGDTDRFGLFVMLFEGIFVPWSRQSEDWIVMIDSSGFVDGYRPTEAREAFEQYVRNFMEDGEDIEDDDPEPWTNREGQPEFNGAFR